jgi:hypothetical protein
MAIQNNVDGRLTDNIFLNYEVWNRPWISELTEQYTLSSSLQNSSVNQVHLGFFQCATS